MRVIGYVRCSTDEQAESDAGLAAQRSAIEAECSHRGLELLEIVEDAGWSAKTLERPGIASALQHLKLGEADALMVAKLDRLSRSMLDFVGMLETARSQDWAIITLDMNVDTSTTQGRMIANVLATFAQFERELISDRTKAALAARKAAGQRLGRPLCIPAHVRDRISVERDMGRSFARIASSLNRDEIPTAHGGSQWWPSTVRAALQAA